MNTTFASLRLSAPLQKALVESNYSIPTPIQAQTIPLTLEGHDVLGCAQTGTGKTAAFALPILEHLLKNPKRADRCAPRVLILAPTRELASQIKASFDVYGRHLPYRSTVIFGGVGQSPQVRAMQSGPDIVVATPGRLLDLLQQRHVSLRNLEIFVLDEADRMLDMGFIHDVKKIIAHLPAVRQSLFFSATMPPVIMELSKSILRNPKRVEVTPTATTVEKIEQRLCHVPAGQKRELLLHLVREHSSGLTLVFSRTKHGANRIADGLEKSGVAAEAIHGNKSQSARERALENFRTGKVRVLIATDIAARGIDVKGIETVINFDLPMEPEAYVHRIGRTARAGAEGRAFTLCDAGEHDLLRSIERIIRMAIPVHADHPFHSDPSAHPRQQQQSRGFGNQNRRPATRSFGSRGHSAPRAHNGPRQHSGTATATAPKAAPAAAPAFGRRSSRRSFRFAGKGA